MPLDVKDFDKVGISRTFMKLGRNQLKIAEFLRDNLSTAFTQREIKQRTGIEFDAAVNTALHSLKIKGLAEEKNVEGTLYWRGKDGLLKINLSDKDSNGQEGSKNKDPD